jgi:hypothetical protein
MLRHLFITICLLFTGNFLFGQDTIHMVDREKIVAKVLEVNPTQVKYKLYSLQTGPTYVVNQKEIWKIVYSDGHTEFFAEDKEEIEIVNIHPLLISVNSFDLMFGFVSLSGDYYFPKQGISVKVPVSIGLQGIKGSAENLYFDNDYYYYNRMKVFNAGAQLLFYPGRMKHRVNYFTGLSFEYGRMFSRQHYYYGPYYPNYGSRKITYDWFGTGIVNGMMINLSNRVTLSMSATLGLQVVYQSYQQNSVGITTTRPHPMGRMDFSLGFRLGKIRTAEKS